MKKSEGRPICKYFFLEAVEYIVKSCSGWFLIEKASLLLQCFTHFWFSPHLNILSFFKSGFQLLPSYLLL